MTKPNGKFHNGTIYIIVRFVANLLKEKGSERLPRRMGKSSIDYYTTLTDLEGLHTYQYDDTYQLTQTTHPVPPTESFSYDAVGNRQGTTVDLNNALLEDNEFVYTYDYNDNLVQKVKKSNGEITTNTYDYENRLTRVQYPGMDAQYKYDALGRRTEKNVNGQVTTYVYDGLNIVADYNGLWTVRSKYLFGLGLVEPLSIDQSGNINYYHGNGLGSVNLNVA